MGTSMTGSASVSLTCPAATAAGHAARRWVSRLWVVVVLGVVSALCAPMVATVTSPVSRMVDDPFGPGLLDLVPADPGLVVPLPASGETLAARLVDDRAPAALPVGLDLAATGASGPVSPIIPTAIMLADPAEAPVSAPEPTVSGSAVALGAPDVSRHGGAGPAMISTTTSGGSASAMIATPVDLFLHESFALARLERRDAEIHPASQPLVRPG